MKAWRVGAVAQRGRMIAWANMDTTKPVYAYAIAPNGLRIDIPRDWPALIHPHSYILSLAIRRVNA